MDVDLSFRVKVELAPLTRLARPRKGAPADVRLGYLVELQQALAADPDRLRRVAELQALAELAHHFTKDLHECEYYGFDQQLTELLRPLVPSLSPEARAWLEPALSHWAWMQSDDGATFATSIRCEVTGPELPYLEPTARDEALLEHYRYDGDPIAAPPPKPRKARGKR